MTEKKPQFIKNLGWRYATAHSMHRRMNNHDYHTRSIYMITLTIEGRQPLLGELQWTASDASDAHILPSALGLEVERCWYAIEEHYPEIKPFKIQLMPDHIHGLLFVKSEIAVHLGKVLNGFKSGCNQAYRRLIIPSSPSPASPVSCPEALPRDNPKHPKQGLLFSPGYQDSVLTGKGQLDRMIRYLSDNPRRLAVKRMNPDIFRVVSNLSVCGRLFAAIGNRWLLDRPVRLQVMCHRSEGPDNLRLIESQKRYFLDRAQKGDVIVSPCISAGEKMIARAVLDARLPLIVILENGFPPMYKPPGKYFDACASGLLLMLAPWPYHMEKRTITRQQCLELNGIASELSTEPWTQQLEDSLTV